MCKNSPTLLVQNMERIVCGDFNTILHNEDHEKALVIREVFHSMGVRENLWDAFRWRKGNSEGTTWHACGGGQSGVCNYICTSDRIPWWSFRVCQPRALRSDHRLLTAEMFAEPPRIQRQYWWDRRMSPFWWDYESMLARKFHELRENMECD